MIWSDNTLRKTKQSNDDANSMSSSYRLLLLGNFLIETKKLLSWLFVTLSEDDNDDDFVSNFDIQVLELKLFDLFTRKTIKQIFSNDTHEQHKLPSHSYQTGYDCVGDLFCTML